MYCIVPGVDALRRFSESNDEQHPRAVPALLARLDFQMRDVHLYVHRQCV